MILFHVGMTLTPLSNLHMLTCHYLDQCKLIFHRIKMLRFMILVSVELYNPWRDVLCVSSAYYLSLLTIALCNIDFLADDFLFSTATMSNRHV